MNRWHSCWQIVTASTIAALVGSGLWNPARGGNSSASVVSVTATASKPDAGGRQSITVTFAIKKDKNWHVYANALPADFPGVPTSVSVDSRIKASDVEVVYPQGKLIRDKELGDYRVYEGKAAVTLTVRRPPGDSKPLILKASFQACYETRKDGQITAGKCLVPSTVQLKVD